jgi:hypothetical protein
MCTAKLAMLIMLAGGAAAIAGAGPAAAYDYPWCVTGGGFGYPGDCSYRSYAQCTASASGRRAWCNINPRAAYGRVPHGRHYRDY